MVALGAVGVALGATAAYLFFGSDSSAASRTSNRMPNTASSGSVGVGYTSPGGGTRDWWHDRNARRRQKHLKMMTSKG